MKSMINRSLKNIEKRVRKNGDGDYLWRFEKNLHTTIDNHNISYQESVSLKKYVSDRIDKLRENISTNTWGH